MIKIVTDKVMEVMKVLRSLQDDRVLVGIPQEKNHRNDGAMTNASIGYVQENGSPARNIPPRPFLIPGVKKVEKEAMELLGEAAKNALEEKEVQTALTKVGILASSSVKKTIQEGEGFAPLSDATIKARQRKGFKGTKPLIRTGQLRNSITFVVRGAND